MSKKPRVDQDLLHRRAQVAVLAGLLRGNDIDALVEAVAPSPFEAGSRPTSQCSSWQ